MVTALRPRFSARCSRSMRLVARVYDSWKRVRTSRALAKPLTPRRRAMRRDATSATLGSSCHLWVLAISRKISFSLPRERCGRSLSLSRMRSQSAGGGGYIFGTACNGSLWRSMQRGIVARVRQPKGEAV